MAKNTREKRDVDVALGGKILVTDAGGQRTGGCHRWTSGAKCDTPLGLFWQPFKVAAGVMKEGQGPSLASNKSHHGIVLFLPKIDNHVGGRGRQ